MASNWGWTAHREGTPTLALIATQTFLSLFPHFHYNTLCVLNQGRTRRLLDWREN
jgi:hypothetical protein